MDKFLKFIKLVINGFKELITSDKIINDYDPEPNNFTPLPKIKEKSMKPKNLNTQIEIAYKDGLKKIVKKISLDKYGFPFTQIGNKRYVFCTSVFPKEDSDFIINLLNGKDELDKALSNSTLTYDKLNIADISI